MTRLLTLGMLLVWGLLAVSCASLKNQNIREECEKLGEVTNVVLYDLEQDGVVSVKYKKPESAAACVELMDGRAFGGQRVEAYIPSERLKFQRSKDNNDDAGEDD